jgi:hypothetical protein
MANTKLIGIYNTIKHEFVEEDYIKLNLNKNVLKRIAQIRTSSQKFCFETGRHGMNRQKLANKACKHCISTNDQETLDLLMELPYPDPMIEDEIHLYYPLYEILSSL